LTEHLEKQKNISMITAFYLSVIVDHDFVTNLAAFFGLIATVGTFIGLYRNKWF